MVLDSLRDSRRLALGVGVAAGLLAAAAAIGLTTVGLDVVFALTVGVSGTTYYSLHYWGQFPAQSSFWRAFLRIFSLLLLATTFVPDAVRLVDGITTLAALFSLGVLGQYGAMLDGAGADELE